MQAADWGKEALYNALGRVGEMFDETHWLSTATLDNVLLQLGVEATTLDWELIVVVWSMWFLKDRVKTGETYANTVVQLVQSTR